MAFGRRSKIGLPEGHFLVAQRFTADGEMCRAGVAAFRE